MVVRGTRDVNNATLVRDGGCLSHVVNQQICQQEGPYIIAQTNSMFQHEIRHGYWRWKGEVKGVVEERTR